MFREWRNVLFAGRSTRRPIGFVDIPLAKKSRTDDAIRLVGWALDRQAVKAVTIEREPFPEDPVTDRNARGLVLLGTATVIEGERPDVSLALPDYPNKHLASWAFELRRNDVAQRENFQTVIHVIAENMDGLTTVLGQREITFAASYKAPPIGFVDVPLTDMSQADHAVRLAGWALDRQAVKAVTIEREPLPDDPVSDRNDRGLVLLGTATVIQGARQDLSLTFPGYPNQHRANWAFELRRDDIAQRENLQVTIHVVAENMDGLTTVLGRRRITFATSHKAPPIGFVDVPLADKLQAGNAVRLAGWALDRQAIKAVTIEREPLPEDPVASCNSRGLVSLGTATFIQGARPDVSLAFPGYPNKHRASWAFELRRDDIAQRENLQVTIHVVAENMDGLTTVLGRREITFTATDSAPPYLFCGRPFDSVFIEANGDVNPYPDCRPERPFGSLLEPGSTLDSIWFGPAFTELRQSIIDRDPPAMCLTCAHFINHNVNDPNYFDPR